MKTASPGSSVPNSSIMSSQNNTWTGLLPSQSSVSNAPYYSYPPQTMMDPVQYAQYLLESYATTYSGEGADVFVDESLGSYVVTSLMHQQQEGVEEGDDSHEALVELLQEHCNLSEQLAEEALDQIQQVVANGVASAVCNQHHAAYASEPSISTFEQQQQQQQTPLSPLHEANILMPGDLLGALGKESFETLRAQQETAYGHYDPFPPLFQRQDSFPSLDASAAEPASKAKAKVPRGKKSSSSGSVKIDASDLAASLFRTDRSRQNSIDELSANSPLPPPPSSSLTSLQQPPDVYYQHQQQQQFAPAHDVFYHSEVPFESALEMLLSMNPDTLSEEAAASACTTAHNDVNLAQYLVEQAMAAPPVCRHLLSSGCYRADCQYSHNLEHHTCHFWMRGRCRGKSGGVGTACPFKHGFHLDQDLLQQIYGTTDTANSFVAPEQAGFGTWGGGGAGREEVGFSESYADFPLASQQQRGSTAQQPTTSFANIAAMGTWSNNPDNNAASVVSTRGGGGVINNSTSSSSSSIPIVKIPLGLWTPHDHRNSSAFHISDPMERYKHVQLGARRDDVIDLHFQSTKTFPVVLSSVLPDKLARFSQVWIVTGTGHHVNSSRTHQKGGGALESAAIQWLQEEGYSKISRGKDRNGQGGAILVEQHYS